MSNLYRLFWRAQLLYCRFWRPVTLGVRAMVFDSTGRILLVKHTYRPGWHFPGGAVNRGENARQGIVRELREEAGIICQAEPEFVPGAYYNTGDHKHDHVLLFVVKEWKREQELMKRGEIADVAFFPLDGLPEDMTAASRRRLGEYVKGQGGGFEW